MIARSSSLALAARDGPPDAALDQFDLILEQWEHLRNEFAERWMLRFLVVLLDRVGASRDAAVLAGALLAAQDLHADLGPYEAPVETTVDHVRARLGDRATDEALADGARLTYPEAVTYARRALRAARRAVGDSSTPDS